MYADTNDRPGLEEQYLTATNTSDLTLNPDSTCAVTHLIAAGLLGNRMGAALVHLRAEWDAAAKPKKATEQDIEFRAGLLLSVLGQGKNGKPDVKRVRTEALLAYATGMCHRAHRLSGWLPALSIMAEWAQLRGVDVDLLSTALYHWLNPTCPVCDGHGVRKAEDAPVLTAKQCHHCNGAGTWPRPLGADRIHDWLKACIGKAKGDRAGLLHGRIDSEDIRERNAKRPTFAAQERTEQDDADAAYFAQHMGKRR